MATASIVEEVRSRTDLKEFATELQGRVEKLEASRAQGPADESGCLDLIADCTRWGLSLYYLQEHRTAFQVLQRAVDLSGGLELHATLAELHHCFGLVARTRGLDHKAELELLVAARMFEALSDRAGEARVADTLGTLYADLGHVVQAREAYEKSLELKRSLGDVAGQAITCGSLGRLFQKNGQLHDAIAMFNEDRSLIGSLAAASGHAGAVHSYRRDLAVVNLALAEVYGESDATLAQALDLADSARAMNETLGNEVGVGISRVVRARILLKREQLDAAADELKGVLAALPSGDAFRQLRGEAIGTLADVRAHQGNLKEAVPLARSAVEQFRAGGYGRQEIASRQRLADLQIRQNRKKEALSQLTTALEGALAAGLQPLVTQIELTIRRLDPHLWYRLVSERFNNFDPSETPAERSVLDLRHGERRAATVMFADVSGYTRMMALREHAGEVDEMMADLNEILSLMSDAVQRFGGMVDKFIGDCIMAVFFPTAKMLESDASRNAVNAAQEIRCGFDAFNRARRFLREAEEKKHPGREPWPPLLNVHIGISTGRVTVGNVGSYRRLSYTVIGDAVNMASRLEGLAVAGQILVDEATWTLVKDWFAGDPGAYQIKGKEGLTPACLIRPGLARLRTLAWAPATFPQAVRGLPALPGGTRAPRVVKAERRRRRSERGSSLPTNRSSPALPSRSSTTSGGRIHEMLDVHAEFPRLHQDLVHRPHPGHAAAGVETVALDAHVVDLALAETTAQPLGQHDRREAAKAALEEEDDRIPFRAEQPVRVVHDRECRLLASGSGGEQIELMPQRRGAGVRPRPLHEARQGGTLAHDLQQLAELDAIAHESALEAFVQDDLGAGERAPSCVHSSVHSMCRTRATSRANPSDLRSSRSRIRRLAPAATVGSAKGRRRRRPARAWARAAFHHQRDFEAVEKSGDVPPRLQTQREDFRRRGHRRLPREAGHATAVARVFTFVANRQARDRVATPMHPHTGPPPGTATASRAVARGQTHRPFVPPRRGTICRRNAAVDDRRVEENQGCGRHRAVP